MAVLKVLYLIYKPNGKELAFIVGPILRRKLVALIDINFNKEIWNWKIEDLNIDKHKKAITNRSNKENEVLLKLHNFVMKA